MASTFYSYPVIPLSCYPCHCYPIMQQLSHFLEWAMTYRPLFAPILPIAPTADTAWVLDLSKSSSVLKEVETTDPFAFEAYLSNKSKEKGLKMAVGGYLEHRNLYSDKAHFNPEADPNEERFIHLGIDVWMDAFTPLFAPMDARVHSFADNNSRGNYGATISLCHEPLPGLVFHSLYGHLSTRDLDGLYVGKAITRGTAFAHIGPAEENGYWAPHLHFQLILDMGNWKGDYPGVASVNSLDFEQQNCPDPNLLLNCPLL